MFSYNIVIFFFFKKKTKDNCSFTYSQDRRNEAAEPGEEAEEDNG